MERKNLLSGATNYKAKRSKLTTYDEFLGAICSYFAPIVDVFSKERSLKRLSDGILFPFSVGLTATETFLVNKKYEFNFSSLSRWYGTFFADKAQVRLQNKIKEFCANAYFDNFKEVAISDRSRGRSWDFLEEFCSKIFPDSTLSKLLQKALLQQAIINFGFLNGASSDFVPVLQGRQGTGKSRFIAALQPVPELFLGEVSAANLTIKDSLIELTSHAVVELAEIESTLGKNSCGLVKAFLTRGKDQFRKPYATEAEIFSRRCAFWGTTNSKEFLQDQTGNRRFVVFPFNFDAKTRENLINYVETNKELLWASLYCLVVTVDDIEELGWRLTAEELAENERQNEGYKKQPRGTAELLDIIEEGPANWQGTASELKGMFPATLGNLSLTTIGSRLKEIPGVEYKKTAGPRLYKLCLRKFVDHEEQHFRAIVDNCKNCLMQFIVPISNNKANWCGKHEDLERILDGFSEEHFDSYVLSHTIRLLQKENVIEEHPDGWKIYLSFKPSFLPSIRFGSVNPEVM